MDLSRGMYKPEEPPWKNGDEVLLVVYVVETSGVCIHIICECLVPHLDRN